MQDTSSHMDALLGPDRLRTFLERQRWFGGKARTIASVRLVDAIEVGAGRWLTLIRVGFEVGDAADYVLPVAVVTDRAADTLRRDRPEAVIAPVDDGLLIDGVFDDAVCVALLELIQSGTDVPSRNGAWTPSRASDATPVKAERIRRTAPDQSNTSIL